MKKKKGIINFIINITITLLLCIVLFILVVLVVMYSKTNKSTMEIADFMGYKPTICVSNSMENEFKVGDIILSKKDLKDSIKVGDIITYREENSIVTHRVQDILYEENEAKYITKGDSNNTVDENVVTQGQVEGVYCYKIPKVGSIILMLQKPQGFIIVFFIPILIVAITYKIIINRKELKEIRKRKLLKRLQEKELLLLK